MKKQTAVEWLADEIIELEEKLRQGVISDNDFFDAKDELFNKALEMENYQNINCYNHGREDVFDWLKKMDYDFLVEEIIKSE